MAETIITPEALAKLQETVDTQSKQIAALTKKVAEPKETKITDKAPELPKIPSKPVTVDGKKYKWNVPVFKMPGSSEAITAEQASTDKEVIEEILKIEGQGLLTELV